MAGKHQKCDQHVHGQQHWLRRCRPSGYFIRLADLIAQLRAHRKESLDMRPIPLLSSNKLQRCRTILFLSNITVLCKPLVLLQYLARFFVNPCHPPTKIQVCWSNISKRQVFHKPRVVHHEKKTHTHTHMFFAKPSSPRTSTKKQFFL